MADEYSINAKITADTSKFNKGVKNAQTSLKGFSKGLSDTINKLGKNGLVGSLANVSLAGAGLTTVFNSVIKITKNIGKAINEVTNAYKGQLMAERALDTAIQNNPYMTGKSSRALKEFASDIQRVSNYGDEELLPLIANLTSLGRTQEEIMQIVRVATDMASTGTMSLDTAIQQLNMTLNGNLGRLGMQNAELKDLTQEELKQGKAVEILGEKFKGLASATVDTSKQLQNLKGDFEEALGQFTLPASDMWNKFWSGFYIEGINALNKFDDYLDYKVIGKKLSKNFEEYYKGLSGTREQKEFAIEDYLAIITDDELNMLELYLKSLNKLNEAQLVTINQIQYEKKHREYKKEVEQQELEIQEKQNKLKEEEEKKEIDIAKLKEEYLAKIEAQKKEWENIKAVTGEEVSTEEKIKFYQDQLLAIMRDSGGQITTNNQYFKDQMAIIKDLENSLPAPEENVEWQKKLLEQKIELLQLEKAERIAIAEETGENIEAIEEEYNEKILDAKIERIEAERREALASVSDEENKEQMIADINAYYDNEVIKAKKETADKKKKINEEEKKDEQNKFKEMLNYAKTFAKNVSAVIQKIVSTIKSVVSGVFNFLQEIVDFNVSDALDTILEFEDGILTFFVETLPKLPSFVASVLQSIGVLLVNLKNYIKAESISDIIFKMLTTLGENLPTLISDLLDILEELINGALDGLIKWLDGGGLVTILNLILKIQQTIEKIFTDNLEKIVNLLADHIDDFANFLADSMTSAQKTLPKIVRSLNKLVLTLIQTLAKVFENEEFINSFVEAIEEIIEISMEYTPKLIKAIVKLIVSIIKALVPKLPEIILTIVNAIVDAIPSIFSELVSSIGQILGALFQAIFTEEFWLDLLGGLWDAILNIFGSVGKLLAGNTDGTASEGEQAGNVIGNILTGGLWGLAKGLFGWANGTNDAPKGLALVGEAGPELVRFNGGEQVLNTRNTQKALANAGGSSNIFNVNFTNVKDTSAYALVSQLKQYNRQMAINGVL